MKKITFIFAIFVSFLFSHKCFSEWNFVNKSDIAEFYIELDSVKKNNDYVFYWRMVNFFEPFQEKYLSVQIYNKGDCPQNRIKTLSYIWFNRGMGRGQSKQEESVNKDWKYPSPDTAAFHDLRTVCK